MRVLGVIGLLALAACGADGEPIRPEAKTTISVGTDGVRASTGVSVRKGPFSVGIGL